MGFRSLRITLLFAIAALAAIPQSFAFYPKSKQLPSEPSSSGYHGIYPDYPTITLTEPAKAAVVKRGEYLAKAGDCIACHTNAAEKGAAYAGGLPLKTPFGTFYSPNITPDKETGIGNWNFNDFKRAMHDGKSPDGANYFPVFPYLYFSLVSDDDLRALYEYLQHIPPVKQKNRSHDVPFPFNVRFAQYGWKILFFYAHDDRYKYNPTQSAAWNRGAYLVNGLGHCGMCHTPLNILGAPKRSYFLTGAFVNGYFAPNITEFGLREADEKDVREVFKADQLTNQRGPVRGPMAEVNHDSLQFLSDHDLNAIAIYLKTVKSESMVARPSAKVISQGRAVYQTACAVCHQDGIAGAPRIGDAANWYSRAKKGRNVLYRQAINGYNQMPARGNCVTCSDEDIEAAVDYLLAESLTRSQQLALHKNPVIAKPTKSEVSQLYQTYCATCHQQGALGAAKVGDKKAWSHLADKGFDVLLTNTLKGNAKMPPKGGCKHCNTVEIKALIKYMLEQSNVDGDYSLW